MIKNWVIGSVVWVVVVWLFCSLVLENFMANLVWDLNQGQWSTQLGRLLFFALVPPGLALAYLVKVKK